MTAYTRTAHTRTPAQTVIRSAILDALAVLMPVDCAGCDGADRALCSRCRAALEPNLTWHELTDGTPVVAALGYEGVARRTILSLKEHGRTDVSRALAAPLAVAIRAAAAALPGPVALLSVPPSRESYRSRGFDPVGLLVRQAGFGVPPRLLAHTRRTEHQKTLGRDSRERNLAGSLSAKHPLHGNFLLVDDVMTTGSTLAEAVRAIRAAGGHVSAAAVLAYTARLFQVPR